MFNIDNMEIINKELLPINNSLLENMFNNIKNYIDCNYKFDYYKLNFDNLILELTPLTPTRKYNGSDINDIKKKIILELENKKNKIKDENKDYLDNQINKIKNCNSKNDLFDMSSDIAQMLARYDEDLDDNSEYKYGNIKKRLEKMISKISFEKDILGRYDYDSYWDDDKSVVENQKIILYINNIIKHQDSYNGIENAIEAILSHEIFHYYHHEIIRDNNEHKNFFNYEFEQRNDYISNVLKESLASFFEYIYCKNHNIKNDLDKSWKYNSIYIYPYSGAEYILKNKDNFKHIIYMSTFTFDPSMLIILNDKKKLYYDLKKINRRIKINYDLLDFIKSNDKLDLNIDDETEDIFNSFNDINLNHRKFIAVDFDVNSEKVLDILDRIIEVGKYNIYRIEKETGIGRRTLNRILEGATSPSKRILIKLCLGLKLDFKTGIELLRNILLINLS